MTWAEDTGLGAQPDVLRKRAAFLAAARARRHATAGFLLQARRRAEDEPAEGVRVGFTCSKKLGNAVTRNRAKRRLRAIAGELLPQMGRPGWDYVLVGRPAATVSRAYADLLSDLTEAMAKIHAPRSQPPRKPRPEAKP